MIDHLCDECRQHFKEVLEFLDEIELPYNLNPHLVRGLDYYTRTVFEIIEDSSEGRAFGTLIGGGRYDNLIKLLGGKDTPGMGAAGGVERIVNLMKEKKIRFPSRKPQKIFLAQIGKLAKTRGLNIFEDFRKAKIPIAESFGRDSLKAQLARADRLGVKYTLILGQKEALGGEIIIRDMRTGRQKTVKIEKVVPEVKKRLKK